MLDYLALTQLQILAFTSPKLSIVSSPDTCALAIFQCHASKNSKNPPNSGWYTSLITLYSYLSKPWYTRKLSVLCFKISWGALTMFVDGGMRAMFLSLKFHLEAILLGLKFANMNFPYAFVWIKSFSN